ncbi:transposase [Hymenobacter terrigena]
MGATSAFVTGQSWRRRRSAADSRLFVNAVLWIARSGAPARYLPEQLGPWNSVYRRFRRWAQKGF